MLRFAVTPNLALLFSFGKDSNSFWGAFNSIYVIGKIDHFA